VILPPLFVPADPNPSGTRLAPVIHCCTLDSCAKMEFPKRRVEFHNSVRSHLSQPAIPDGVVVNVLGSVDQAFREILRSQ